MDLYKEILIKLLEKESVEVRFENFNINMADIVECASYQALQKIKTIIEDESLEDSECFMRIEEIVCVFESLGSSGGNRHDFG